jgi:hypothetical protein
LNDDNLKKSDVIKKSNEESQKINNYIKFLKQDILKKKNEENHIKYNYLTFQVVRSIEKNLNDCQMIAFKSKDELQIEEYFKHDQSNDEEALSNDLIDNIQKKNSMFIETLNPNDQINVYMVFSNKLEKNINNHL